MKAVEIERHLLERVRSLPKGQRHEVGAAIAGAQETFGKPHQHAGLGLRKLPHGHFEVRLGLGQRLVFEDRGDTLHFKLLGNHDEVRRFLKGLR